MKDNHGEQAPKNERQPATSAAPKLAWAPPSRRVLDVRETRNGINIIAADGPAFAS